MKKNNKTIRQQQIARRSASPRVPRPITGPPLLDKMILKYVDQVTITPSTGTVGSHTFRANSIYDPDYTGVGHQPLYHDQLSLIYSSYLVTKSTLKATLAISGTTGGSGMVKFGAALTSLPALASVDPFTVAESRLVKTKVLSNKINTNIPTTVTQHFDASRDFGVTNPRDARSNIGGSFGANPPNNKFYQIVAWNTNASVAQLPLTVDIEIEYHVDLADRRLLLGS